MAVGRSIKKMGRYPGRKDEGFRRRFEFRSQVDSKRVLVCGSTQPVCVMMRARQHEDDLGCRQRGGRSSNRTRKYLVSLEGKVPEVAAGLTGTRALVRGDSTLQEAQRQLLHKGDKWSRHAVECARGSGRVAASSGRMRWEDGEWMDGIAEFAPRLAADFWLRTGLARLGK